LNIILYLGFPIPDKEKDRKKILALLIVLSIIIIPLLGRCISSGAFAGVRAIYVVSLFVAGIIVGALIVMIKDYYKMGKE